jgi:serine protease
MNALSLRFISILSIILLNACAPDSLPNNKEVVIQVTQSTNGQIKLSTKNSSLPINQLKWEFGDGYYATGSRVQHRYISAGEYNITLHYQQGGEYKTQNKKVFIEGESNTLSILSETAVTIDSDHNDPNQPFTSNNETPQVLSAPTTLSGILMEKGECQAGRLCKSGDTIDLYQFDLEHAQSIQFSTINGNITFELRDQNNRIIKHLPELQNDLHISADLLPKGRYFLSLTLPFNVSKAQYWMKIDNQTSFTEARHQPGKLIVHWHDSDIPELVDIQDPRLGQSHSSAISARSALLSDNRIKQVSLNYYRYPSSNEPTDFDVWQWPLNQLNIQTLWQPLLDRGFPPGDGAIVAVLDSGIFFEHENFSHTQFIDGYDFVSDILNSADGNGWDRSPDDPGGNANSFHGTHVTGIIAAISDAQNTNQQQSWISGIAWGTKIMPLRVLGQSGGTSYDLIQALRYAAKLPNDSGRLPEQAADVINLSLGGSEFSPIEQATFTQVINSGVIVVAAAGNKSSQRIDYPAAYPGVVAVGALDQFGQSPSYSNVGNQLDVLAPGGSCLDSLCTGGVMSLGASGSIHESGYDNRTSQWARLSGTSMAAAHVSGLLAILKGQLPGTDSTHITNWLNEGRLTQSYDNNTFTLKAGYGVIDPYKILDLIDNTEDLESGIWSDQNVLHLSPKESVTINLIQRGYLKGMELSWQYDSNYIELIETTNGARLTLIKDTPDPLRIQVNTANGKHQVIQVFQRHPITLPLYAHHLYVELEDQITGLRTIRQEDTWTVNIPLMESPSLLRASTDIDYDGVYCESGEFCALSEILSNQETNNDTYGNIYR